MRRNIVLAVFLLSAIMGTSMVLDRVSAQKDDLSSMGESSRPDAVLLTEDFAFSGALNANGWTAHSGAGTNPPATTGGLTFAGYPGSGTGNAALIGNGGGEDVNKPLSAEFNTNGGTIYMSALVNVNETAADKTGDYFLHLGDRTAPETFTFFAGRVYARVVGNAVNFGLSNTGTATYGTTNFAKNTTYLVIVKYTIDNTGNDPTQLWVLPTTVPASEGAAGAPEVSNTGTTGQDVIDAVGLRQGSNVNQPSVIVDSVRVANTWAELVGGGAGPTPTPTPAGSPSPTPTVGPSPSPTVPSTVQRNVFTTRLSGAQEVPANNSTGRGFGRVVLNAAQNEITASFYWEGLSSGTISGHIHGPAAVGVNAPILFNMNPTTGLTSGSTVDRTFAVTPAQVADLRAGLWYFNIHTTNFTGGEIRGQIVTTTNDAPSDFNGDGRTDFAVVRPTAGVGGTQARWYTLTNDAAATQRQEDFGVTSDFITPGDYDGDGKDDIAVWRSQVGNSGFYILQSSTNTLRFVRFGLPGDDPSIVQDYDGDGIDDPAIYRSGEPEGGQAYFWWYGSYGATKNVQVVVPWGLGGVTTGDSAIPGDYNGDGKADFVVYRSVSNRGILFVHYGTGGFDAASPNDAVIRFGLPSDTFVPGDWDGDGITDFSVSRIEGANLAWYHRPSSNPGLIRRLAWGRNGPDLEVQGDYDGDGRTDYAIWRNIVGNSSVYFILRSSDQSVQYQIWGSFGDANVAQDTHNQ